MNESQNKKAKGGEGEADLPPSAALKGAPPSNTAPTNDISQELDLKILRYAVDSLYISYQGELSDDLESRLRNLKALAQSLDPREQAKAQLKIFDHVFEVKARGKGKFNYVLADGWFYIQIAGKNAKTIPMAYVQLSSELLTLVGLEESINLLKPIINTIGKASAPNISRIDPCVDFVCPIQMDSWTRESWVTRAHNIDSHSVNGQFSGWSIGQGGIIIARLYNKTLELQKSKKEYLKPIWARAGWNGIDDIWRLEFQVRGQTIGEKEFKQLPIMLILLDSLWDYCIKDWCRLTIPNSNDSRRARWPTHPLWLALSEIDWGGLETVPLMKPVKTRAPTDEALFVNGLGAITSFMAREGIENWSEGFGEYIAQAKEFHDEKGRNEFTKYINKKRKEKERRFNTKNNNPNRGLSIVDRLDQAEAYRKAKDGE